MAHELANGDVLCEQCGNEYSLIGGHWSKSQSCIHPRIPESMMELIEGWMLGDGDVNWSGKNPSVRFSNTNLKQLAWLQRELGWLATTVRQTKTAEEAARNARESGFRPDADAADYRDYYRLNTRRHPQFNRFRHFGKRSKDEQTNPCINLTKRGLKAWYIGDGTVSINDGHVQWGTRDTSVSNDFWRGLLEEHGFSPSISTTEYDDYMKKTIRLSTDDSHEFLEWLGDPPSGFEYKWELDDRERYERLYQDAYSYTDGEVDAVLDGTDPWNEDGDVGGPVQQTL